MAPGQADAWGRPPAAAAFPVAEWSDRGRAAGSRLRDGEDYALVKGAITGLVSVPHMPCLLEPSGLAWPTFLSPPVAILFARAMHSIPTPHQLL